MVDKTIHGAFLDWGLKAKDLFLPNRNMQGRVEAGRSYVVFLYNDNVTGRVVATMLAQRIRQQPGADAQAARRGRYPGRFPE
ncbi:MAG: S1-like domain-containing RNA-binding protein [Alistipes indistinctus]